MFTDVLVLTLLAPAHDAQHPGYWVEKQACYTDRAHEVPGSVAGAC
jgi:hypothetical protein